MKIDDPKTPFNDDSMSDGDYDPEAAKADPETEKHLSDAQKNRMANSKTTSGVKRKSDAGA